MFFFFNKVYLTALMAMEHFYFYDDSVDNDDKTNIAFSVNLRFLDQREAV